MARRKGRPPLLRKFVSFDPTQEYVSNAIGDFLKKGGKITKVKTVDRSEEERILNAINKGN